MNFDSANISSNVIVNHHGDVATRISLFNDAIVTSKQSLRPGQLFSIRVNANESIWDGNLRLGLSMLPDSVLFPLPSYSIPDLIDRGGTWMWAIDNDFEMEKSTQNNISNSFVFDRFQSIPRCSLEEKKLENKCKCCLSTSYGDIPLYQLMSECFDNSDGRCAPHNPGSAGSIISIYYDVSHMVDWCEFNEQCNVLEAPDCAGIDPQMNGDTDLEARSVSRLCFKYTFHVLINGQLVNVSEDLIVVSCPRNTSFSVLHPFNYLPEMRAIVDVYGSTKCVQIMAFEQRPVKSLQDMCVHQLIKDHGGYQHMDKLPKSLRNYLQIQLHKLIHLNK